MEERLSPIETCPPAKLNLHLKVVGRRPDGYHDLVTLMVPVTLFDRLRVERSPEPGVRLNWEGIPVPSGTDNIVCRAAHSFLSRIGSHSGLDIDLLKRIPVAAGLGGGSSDAAYTLRAMNRMWADPLSHDQLAEMAGRLGADVPFFLQNGPCLARGIGERVEPVKDWPRYWYVVITPPVKVSTGWVYSRLRLKELTPKKDDFIIESLGPGALDLAHVLENDLETVTAPHFPEINRLKKSLMDAGAAGALMSGSGPSVFGVFRAESSALRAKSRLLPQKLGDVFVVEGL